MCCFNRPMPKLVNNCTVVPAVPIQAAMNGVPLGMPACGPTVPLGMPACGPTVPFYSDAVVPNGVLPNSYIPSGTAPDGNLSGLTCNANFETVQSMMEQPLQCAPTVIHHHNRVQHMVPCIKTNVHHVHNHHEWLPFEQAQMDKVVNCHHGVRPSDQLLCNSV